MCVCVCVCVCVCACAVLAVVVGMELSACSIQMLVSSVLNV